jgi:hypothetical protein
LENERFSPGSRRAWRVYFLMPDEEVWEKGKEIEGMNE